MNPLWALEQTVAEQTARADAVTARVTAAAAATVTGTDEGGLVTVTATGAGEILSVRVSTRTLRDLHHRDLAARVTTAVNAALAAAEATLAEASATGGDDPDLDRRYAVHEQRMDEMLDRLDRLNERLDRILG